MATHVLFEHAAGYGLFEVLELEEIGSDTGHAKRAIAEYDRFKRIVTLKSFRPFETPESALANVNAVSEGVLHDDLADFLKMNLQESKKSKKSKKSSGKLVLGVAEDKLGTAIQEVVGVKCVRNEATRTLVRGIRMHFKKFVKALSAESGAVELAQLGLAHAYSRAKVKFNVNRVDNMIVQSIALLDQLDKDLNTFAMRVREWYGWHFPELVKIAPDNIVYARLALYIKQKDQLGDKDLEPLEAITLDAEQAEAIVEAARTSMGQDISDFDILNVCRFAERVVALAEYRASLFAYLEKKMHDIAPNLTALIGEMVGARLISQAGSLTNLAKYPASTVQILGAEKALFRALKTRSNTPKYGLIYHSTFIGRAGAKNKGRVSRYLANKCSMASRIDSFSDAPTDAYGKKLREQVEERLRFYESGVAPRKNLDVMLEAQELAAAAAGGMDDDSDSDSDSDEEEEAPKKKKKRSSSSSSKSDDVEAELPKKRSSKKKKKSSSSSSSSSKRSSSSKGKGKSSSSSSSSSGEKKKSRKRSRD